jgi:hypothetical protein
MKISTSIILAIISLTSLAKVLPHSTDDYRRRTPLAQAIKLGFQSVEADIFYRKNEVRVGSTTLTTIGSLKELYLEPMKKIIERQGYIGHKNKTFYLWLDIRSSYRKLPTAVYKTLSEYDFLTTLKDGKFIKHRPVTVIISGRDSFKTEFFKLGKNIPALKEGLNQDDNLNIWTSVDWQSITSWHGANTIDAKLKTKLTEIVNKAHDLGKKIRFKNVPETEAIWSELVSAKVDMIGAQNIQKLSNFLNSLKNKNL